MTHATRALKSHDLLREEINFGSHTYFFDHTRTWRVSPDEWSAKCRGHLWDNTNIKDDTRHSHTHTHIHSNKADMILMIMMAKWYSRSHGGKKLPDICLTGEETPRKNLTQETCPDRGLNPGVTGVHATACSTAVELRNFKQILSLREKRLIKVRVKLSGAGTTTNKELENAGTPRIIRP